MDEDQLKRAVAEAWIQAAANTLILLERVPPDEARTRARESFLEGFPALDPGDLKHP